MEKILEGKRIFLVEDDVMNIAVFTTSLSKHGASVQQDAFGYGIIDHIVQSWPIDLIVLDIMLRRGLNGYDIFDQLRAHPKLKDVPVVA